MIVDSHYLGCLEYYSLILSSKDVIIEVNDLFQKQTYRNRCYLLTANKIQPLVIPVKYSSKSLTKEVKLDHSQRWVKDHWGAFYSAYGKAPFFEYFSEIFRAAWNKKHTYLIDANADFLLLTLKLLQVNVNVTYTERFESEQANDFRGIIRPKQPFESRGIYVSRPYNQLFGDVFAPNLSVVDLIMCEGPQAVDYLKASFL